MSATGVADVAKGTEEESSSILTVPIWDEAPVDKDPLERKKLTDEEYEVMRRQHTTGALRELRNQVRRDPHLYLSAMRRRDLEERGIWGVLSDEVRTAAGLSGGREEKERQRLAALHRNILKVDCLGLDHQSNTGAAAEKVLTGGKAGPAAGPLIPRIKPRSPSGKTKVVRSKKRANWAWKQLAAFTSTHSNSDQGKAPRGVKALVARGLAWTSTTRDVLAHRLSSSTGTNNHQTEPARVPKPMSLLDIQVEDKS